jgi:hypothetical protein
MGLTLEEFAEKYKLKLKSMTIDEVVSPFPRTILIPECPKCKNNIFLSHPEYRPDPFIESKRDEGVFGSKYPQNRKWLAACWTAECDFFIALRKSDLVQCPECKRYYLDMYSLYDHMRYQCTRAARTPKMLKKAGCDKYLGGLMVVEE